MSRFVRKFVKAGLVESLNLNEIRKNCSEINVGTYI
jgi:hypothetical protein